MAIGTATALIGSALIGAGGSYLSGKSAADAAGDASAAQLQAERERLALEKEIWNYGKEAYQPYRDAGSKADAYMSALYYGSGSYGGGSSGGPARPTDWNAYIEANPSMRQDWANMLQNGQAARFGNDITKWAERHWEKANPGAGKAGSETQVGRGDVMDMVENNPLYQMADENYTEANREGQRAYGEERQLNSKELTQGRALNLNELYAQTGNNEADYAKRTGFTDQAVADRAKLNEIYQGENSAKMTSSLGGGASAGMVGKLARQAQENSDKLNFESAAWEREARNEDYDPYSTNRFNITGDYYGNERDAYGNFYGNNRDAMRTKNTYRKSNLATRNAGRTLAYGDVTDYLGGQSETGKWATSGSVNAGQQYAANAGASMTRGASAYAQGLLNQANAYGNMWEDVAGFGGELMGGLGKSKPSGNSWNGYKSYGSDSSGGTWWG